jgi:alkyl sulfatase BDS1-like metallo-beta-lactamase superfamily hydrolase
MQAKTTTRHTAMAIAFVEALGGANVPKKLVNKVVKVGSREGAGTVRERDINANLSHRTAKRLQQDGVL